jgi:hypothetical protein
MGSRIRQGFHATENNGARYCSVPSLPIPSCTTSYPWAGPVSKFGLEESCNRGKGERKVMGGVK